MSLKHSLSDAVEDQRIMRETVLEQLLEEARKFAKTSAETIPFRCCDGLVRCVPDARFASWYPQETPALPVYATGSAANAGRALEVAGLRLPSASASPAQARAFGVDAPELAHWRTNGRNARISHVVIIELAGRAGHTGGLLALGLGKARFLTEGGLVSLLAFARLAEAHMDYEQSDTQLGDARNRDPLTKLLNRQGFLEIAERAHAQALETGGAYSIALFDVDHLKRINNEHGYKTGDELLKVLGTRFGQLLPPQGVLARWSGEEFVGLLPGVRESEAALMAEHVQNVIHEESFLTLSAGSVGISAGVASFPGHPSVTATIAAATTQLGQAANDGLIWRRIHLPAPTDGDLHLMAQVRAALTGGRIRAAYQPIVDLATGRVVAEEALARLVSQDGKTDIPAARFIEIVTRFDLVHEIDAAVVRATLGHCAAQVLAGDSRLHFVNMSAAFLRHPELVDEIFVLIQKQCQACGHNAAAPKPLVIEITEREFLQDTATALAVLQPLLDFGLRIAIDDFGSGYSSFRYLVDLPVDFVKLDGELVRKIASDRKARTVVQSMQRLAHDLGLVTVAEYVENELSRTILRDMGVQWGQGYLFGKPQRADSAMALS